MGAWPIRPPIAPDGCLAELAWGFPLAGPAGGRHWARPSLGAAPRPFAASPPSESRPPPFAQSKHPAIRRLSRHCAPLFAVSLSSASRPPARALRVGTLKLGRPFPTARRVGQLLRVRVPGGAAAPGSGRVAAARAGPGVRLGELPPTAAAEIELPGQVRRNRDSRPARERLLKAAACRRGQGGRGPGPGGGGSESRPGPLGGRGVPRSESVKGPGWTRTGHPGRGRVTRP